MHEAVEKISEDLLLSAFAMFSISREIYAITTFVQFPQHLSQLLNKHDLNK